MAWKYRGWLLASLALAGCQDEPMQRGAVETERIEQGVPGPEVTDSHFIDPVKDYYHGQVSPVVTESRELLAESRAQLDAVRESSVATNNALKEVKENVASARQTYVAAKKDLAETAATVKSGVRTVGAVGRYVVSKVPTSEKEANDLVAPREHAFYKWVREKYKAFENYFRRNLDPKRLKPRSRPTLGGDSKAGGNGRK